LPAAGNIEATIREAIDRWEAESGTLNQLAAAAGVPYPMVYRFARGSRPSITLATADKLAAALGLELRPAKKTTRKQ
jgi:hypothetical protein